MEDFRTDHSRMYVGIGEIRKKVASGVYFYRLETREFSKVKKRTLIK
jgi:hypothetical protein